MKQPPLGTKLKALLGHLVADTKEQKRNLESLNQSIAKSSLDEEDFKISDFKFEKSDLFFAEKISSSRLKDLDNLAERKVRDKKEPSFKVFTREVPLREQLIYGSVPKWAAGAKIDHTIGPFTNKDGRQYWFDFFPIKKLIALYIQGINEPVLLFNIREIKKTKLERTRAISRGKTYNLSPGTVWIYSKYLASNAPVGKYTGLTITGGKVRLSNLPQVTSKKLTVAANTAITVDLNLKQPEVTDSKPKSSYGIDARNMQLELPTTFKFNFSATHQEITGVGRSSWKLYGQSLDFAWDDGGQVTYDPQVQRILIPLKSKAQQFKVSSSKSPFNKASQQASIAQSNWALETATIDILQPLEASGIGGVMVACKDGINCSWQGLTGGVYNLIAPTIFAIPGQYMIADLSSANPHITQKLELWKDELNPFASTVELTFNFPTPYYYVNNANGTELLMTFTNADFQIDRPVKVNAEPPEVASLNSLLLIAATDTNRLIYLFDDNLIQDDAEIHQQDPIIPERMSLAIKNALFKVTQANGCLLFGSLAEDFVKVNQGFLFLTFGLYAYIPTLPDPYAANLGILQRQIRGIRNPSFDTVSAALARSINAWLVCRIYWNGSEEDEDINEVEVSFHFAPLTNQFAGISFDIDEDEEENIPASSTVETSSITTAGSGSVLVADPVVSSLNQGFTTSKSLENVRFSLRNEVAIASVASDNQSPLPDYESSWNKLTERYQRNIFALLDVSTNADMYGISFNLFSEREQYITTHRAINTTAGSPFPIQVDGMDVVSQGMNVKAFTVPQISWEPTLNLTAPQVSGDPNQGPNYYPNDGGPMQILNNSDEEVILAPIPYNQFLDENMENNEDFAALSFFTLPFGMKALALLKKKYDSGNGNTRRGGRLKLTSEDFTGLKAANQLSLIGGEAQAKEESDMFQGQTVQLANILNLDGSTPTFPKSTLGENVTKIFNNEFFIPSEGLTIPRGVPLERIDLSGYGASAFSNWLNPKAAIAETSQAKFDIFVGRTGHEVIQVTSIMYPWAIRVVRTITLFRVGSGYVYRYDTGWRAESDGNFLFTYYTKEDDGTGQFDSIPQAADFEIHPGIIKGLYNVKDIIETEEIADFTSTVIPKFLLNEATGEATLNTGNESKEVELQPVYFNADVEIENPTAGFHTKKFKVTDDQGEVIDEIERKVVASKKILGFVQIAPRGVPITSDVLKQLVTKHATIGGPIDCEVSLANSAQKMRLNRFDFNNSFAADGTSPTFAVAGRGNVLLPKDGSWSMVKHERGTGEVSPVPTNLSVPVIRKGMLYLDLADEEIKIDTDPKDVLLRIANPTELERTPVDDTLNYGFLQSMDTQKALFLTPSFELDNKKLLSKTPPLFVDTMRIVNSNAVFPNIGDAENTFGDAISLIQNNNEFDLSSILDEGFPTWELMDVMDEINNIKDQGYKLLKSIPAEIPFSIPDASFDLIDLGDGNFRIYIEYKDKDSNQGNIDFDIDSLAGNIADTWKSKMSNIGLVIDLAGIDRLMTIRGKWDSKKGAEASYPEPDLEFSPELQPVIDILQILQQLQGGDYAGAVANGLKLAMSNKAGTWEYKFEASKEIPVLRFPVPDAVYNDPNTPFKLEAGLTIGAYFNAALKVTTDANELLPSAGGLLGFYGKLSVMCVSLSAATVYAIGQVNLDIAADTKIGPSLRMKFGFGAQIVIGLPVAGNVSVSFVTGVEIFAAASQVDVTAFLIFEGHAEILGGLVSITIMIEAKGTVSRKQLSGGGGQTDIACQVTFGLDISIFLVINISFSTSWQEQRQIA